MRILIRPKTTASSDPPRVIALKPPRIVVPHRPMRVLDFDVEARPLHWISGDYVSKEITAMAWAWTDAPTRVKCFLLGEDDPVEMLIAFLEDFERADMVTGHYITGYDLPMVNGALMEYLLQVLPDKMAHDTKVHLVKRAGLSMSQESLGAMLRLDHKKVQMNQGKWREANRLTPAGRALARERVVGDVQQHIEMYSELKELNYLAPPVVWRSGSAKLEAYQP